MQYALEQYHLQVEVNVQECEFSLEDRARMQPELNRIGEAVKQLPLSQLWLTLVFHPNTGVYHAQAKLKVPGNTIVTGHYHGALAAAVRHCVDKVIRRVREYQANPDQQALRLAQGRARLTDEVIPPGEPDAGAMGEAVQRGDYAAFRHALLGQESRVRMHVGRWVQRYPKVQQQIGRSFEIADFVEEVFLLAFDRYPQRPMHVPLHSWLEGLIDPAVKALWHQPEEREAVSYAQTLGQVGRNGTAS
jgi:hypothetical protein